MQKGMQRDGTACSKSDPRKKGQRMLERYLEASELNSHNG
jgi:hypothetical protein